MTMTAVKNLVRRYLSFLRTHLTAAEVAFAVPLTLFLLHLPVNPVLKIMGLHLIFAFTYTGICKLLQGLSNVTLSFAILGPISALIGVLIAIWLDVTDSSELVAVVLFHVTVAKLWSPVKFIPTLKAVSTALVNVFLFPNLLVFVCVKILISLKLLAVTYPVGNSISYYFILFFTAIISYSLVIFCILISINYIKNHSLQQMQQLSNSNTIVASFFFSVMTIVAIIYLIGTTGVSQDVLLTAFYPLSWLFFTFFIRKQDSTPFHLFSLFIIVLLLLIDIYPNQQRQLATIGEKKLSPLLSGSLGYGGASDDTLNFFSRLEIALVLNSTSHVDKLFNKSTLVKAELAKYFNIGNLPKCVRLIGIDKQPFISYLDENTIIYRGTVSAQVLCLENLQESTVDLEQHVYEFKLILLNGRFDNLRILKL